MSERGNKWNAGGGPKYPHEKAIQFMFRRFSPSEPEKRVGVRVLDLGCGSGVNTAFLAREGFTVLAVDASSVGVENTRALLAREGLTAEVSVTPMEELELPPASIDVVLSMGVIDVAGPEAAAEGLKRVSKCLTPGGVGLFMFASELDFRAGHPAITHVYTEPEVHDLFGAWPGEVWYDRVVTTYENGRNQQNDWLITIHA